MKFFRKWLKPDLKQCASTAEAGQRPTGDGVSPWRDQAKPNGAGYAEPINWNAKYRSQQADMGLIENEHPRQLDDLEDQPAPVATTWAEILRIEEFKRLDTDKDDGFDPYNTCQFEAGARPDRD